MSKETEADLRASALDDLLRGLGITHALSRRVLGPPLAWFARRFAGEMLEMDRLVGEQGFGAAADYLLGRFAGCVTVEGAEHVPADGPLLVVANHCGTVDIVCLWHLLRHHSDVKIIALDRPILRAVPHLASRLIYVNGDRRVLDEAAAHLAGGGTLITFPAGAIEPDPMLRPADAVASLERWHPSTRALLKRVPDLAVLPVAIGGVISTRWLRRPPARWRRRPEDRELAAATIQVALRDRSVRPRVVVGPVGSQDRMATLLHAASGSPHGD